MNMSEPNIEVMIEAIWLPPKSKYWLSLAVEAAASQPQREQ